MSHSVAELCQLFEGLVTPAAVAEGRFESIDSPDAFSAQSLIFVSDVGHLTKIRGTQPAVIVTDTKLAEHVSTSGVLLVSDNVRLAQAIIKQHYRDYDALDSEWDAVHPNAVVHPSAQLGDGVRIGANSVIGKDVIIGDNTVVRANCVIEHSATLGQDCIINNLVNIGQACVLGDRVLVRPGAIIGNEGFGFAQDDENHYHRVPHTGIVVIEDDVQIGTNCNIDRATYGETVIKRGVKMDALCHVAHNCIVDEDTLFIAQTGIAGSCKIGKRVICSGHTGVLDHRTIVDDVILVHRCGVTEDITSPGMWAGTPAKPFKEYVSNLNQSKRTAKQLAKLQAQIDELKLSLGK